MAATRECRPLYSNRPYSNQPLVYASVDNSRAFRKRNAGNVISSSAGSRLFFGAPIRIWLPSAASAPVYFYLDCVRERYSLRSVDIWREGLIKLVFCGGRDVNEPLSNEQPIVIWTMASFDSDYFYYWKWYLASFKGRYDIILIRYKKKNHNHCQ